MKYAHIICIMLLLATAACKKEILPEAPAFSVTSTALTFTAGQEGVFEFDGTAGIIAFYSGETGREYMPDVHDGKNKAISVKGNSDSRLRRYTYTYATKGVYKAFFIAKNANIYGSEEVVQEVTVTVNE